MRRYLFVFLLPWLCGSAQAKEISLLLIPSYGPSQWNKKIAKGLAKEVAPEVKITEFKFNIYPESLRTASETENEKRRLQNYLSHKKPDIIVIADDEAADFFLANIKWHKPIFFTGINQSATGFLKKASARPNFTGIFEKPALAESVELIKDLSKQNSLTINILLSPVSSSKYIIKEIKQFFAANDDIKIGKILSSSSWSRWQQFVKDSNYSADALWIFSPWRIKNDQGQSINKSAAGDWLTENILIPSLSSCDLSTFTGAMASISITPELLGREVGKLITRHLDKKIAVKDIPMQSTKLGEIMINLRATDRIGIQVPIEILEYATVLE